MKLRRYELRLSAAAAAAAGCVLAGACCWGAFPRCLLAGMAVAALPMLKRPAALLFLGGMAMVLLSYAARSALPSRIDFGNRAVRGRMLLRSEDSRVSRLPGISDGMRNVTAALLEFDGNVQGALRDCGGAKVFLRIPAGARPPRYGALMEAEGTLMPVSALRSSDGGFDLVSYLRRGGFSAVAAVDSFRVVGRERGVRGALLDLRDAMLERLFSGVRSDSVRRLAAALYCGVAGGMPAELRREFAAAGIIHIFSVSGMHVAVLALFLGFILRAVPFRFRYPLLVFALWLYVFATGANTPAVRAGIMLTLWSLLRMALFRVSGFDVLCWTAALLLIADPWLVADTGAQYSFVITGALLLLAEHRNRVKFPHPGPGDLVPVYFSSPRERRLARLAGDAGFVLLSAVIAFLAGAGISLEAPPYRLVPGAVAANILVSLLMPWYFLLFFIQLGAGCCGAGALGAPLFEGAFHLLRGIAVLTAELFSSLDAAPPHWTAAAVYSLALLIALKVRTTRIRIAAAAVAAILGSSWILLPVLLPPELMVRSSTVDSPPMVAVVEPERGIAVVINLPDYEGAAAAAKFFRMHGVRSVELVGFSAPRSGCARAVASLAREMPLRRVRLPEERSRSVAFAGMLEEAGAGLRFESAAFHRDLFRIIPMERGFRLDYSNPGSKLCFSVTVEEGDDGRMVALRPPSGTVLRKLLPWSLHPGTWKYEFERKN